MSAGTSVVIIFGMFFLACLAGLKMLIDAFKDSKRVKQHLGPTDTHAWAEASETIPMRINGQQQHPLQ